MAFTVSFNNTTYTLPSVGDRLYASNVNTFLTSLANNAFSKAGGTFTLTADANFGATYGLVSSYFKSRSSNISTTGVLRLANNEGVGFRNAANSADKVLKVNASDRLDYDGYNVVTTNSTDTLTNKSIDGSTNTLTNVATSSFVSTTGTGAVVLASGASLSSPSITTPTGIVKGDVGLGNVDNTSDATKNSATATLTNKTIVSPIIDDYLELNEESAPSTPSSGKVRVYAKTDKKIYTKDSAGTELQVGASGSGEINAITTGSTDATGWSTGTGVNAPTTDTSNSPLSPVTTTSLAVTGTSGVVIGSQTSAYGAIKSITMPTGLLNRKLKVEFYYTTPASSLGTWAVSVYQGSTRLSLSTDSSGDTILPSGVTGGKFTAYFDTNSNTSYSVNLVQRTYTSSNTIYVTQVIVGPGIQPQGAVVGDWQSYSATPTNFGSVTAATYEYRRIGDSVEVQGKFTPGTTSAAEASVTLPSGMTFSGNKNLVGRWYRNNATGSQVKSGPVYVSGNTIYFSKDDYTTASSPFVTLNASSIVSSGEVFMYKTELFPIAEWAGSGTVNLAQNDLEYAYNNSATTSSDTTSFGYGPTGFAIQNFAPAGTAGIAKRVRFQTPKQDNEIITLEFNDGNGFLPAADRFFNGVTANDAATTWFGVNITQVNSTDFDVNFRSAAIPGVNWSGINTWKWRLKKAVSNSASGFGLATGTTSGLVKKNRQQTKYQSANVSYSTTGNGNTISSLAFNNLTVGQMYRLSGQAIMYQTGNNSGGTFRVFNGGTEILACQNSLSMSEFSAGEELLDTTGISYTFTATATTIACYSYGNGGSVIGNGTSLKTFLTLEEVNNVEETTAWT